MYLESPFIYLKFAFHSAKVLTQASKASRDQIVRLFRVMCFDILNEPHLCFVIHSDINWNMLWEIHKDEKVPITRHMS